MSELLLKIAGRRYGGWTELRVMRSLETIADTFELRLTERWSGGRMPRPIAAGTPCELWHGDERVVTGYVDEVQPEYDAKEQTLRVNGRSKTGDLVDCSLPSLPFNNRSLLEIAGALAEPFGITVSAETDVGPRFKKLVLEDGQTIFEFLEHAARIRAVRLVSRADGGMVITRAGRERVATALVRGENILRASGSFSSRERFSDYIVQAQQGGNDETWGEVAAAQGSTATDTRIGRYRPTVIVADGPANTADCQRRAEWARNTAFGRGQGVVYTVNGWSHARGLWAPNTVVPVRDDFMGVDDARLIVSVQLMLDAGGRRAELRVMPREAFELVPLPEPDAEGDQWAP